MKKKKLTKAQTGKEVVKGSRPGMGVFRTEKERTTVGGIAKPYKYTTTSMDTTGYAKGKDSFQVKTVKGEADKLGYNKVTLSSSKSIPKDSVMSKLKSLQKKKGGSVKTKK